MSGIIDYGNLGSSSSNQVNTPTSSISNDGGKPSPLSASSIQQSELEASLELMVANLPILMMPQSNGNSGVTANSSQVAGAAGTIDMNVETIKNNIINKMWDSYLQNIHEIAERAKKEDIKKHTVDAAQPGPKSSGEYLLYLLALSPTARADEMGANGLSVQFTQTYNNWLVNPVDSGNNSAITAMANAYPSASFIAGCVACNPDAIHSAIAVSGGAAVLGVALGTNPGVDAILGAVGSNSGLPGDYQAAAALIAALLNGGAVYKATAETIAAGGGKPQFDLNFAVNYAKNVMTIVTKNIEGQEPANPQRAAQNNMIRLMLSVMALNMVYRSAYGGMQGKEFEELLSGNSSNLSPEIKGLVEQLVSLVNAYLPQDPEGRAGTVSDLMEYVDSKDSVDSMLETSKLFASFLNTDDIDANRLASGKS